LEKWVRKSSDNLLGNYSGHFNQHHNLRVVLDRYFFVWLLLFLKSQDNKADIEWFQDRALWSFARLPFCWSGNIAESRNHKQSPGFICIPDSCYTDDDDRRTLWSIFSVSVSTFISLFYSISSHSRRSGTLTKKKKRRRRTFCVYCSFLFASFLYSVSFDSLFLSSSYCRVFQIALCCFLLIVYAYIRLQTQCAKANIDNDQVKPIHSLHNVIISVNQKHNYNRHYNWSYLSLIFISLVFSSTTFSQQRLDKI
jgi:hypothetical protein